MAQRAEKEGTEFLASTMPEKAVGNQPPPGATDTLRKIIREAPPKGVAAAARAMATRPDATPQLATISCPIVVFAGRQDKIVPDAESEAMAKGIPGARLVWCERSGHVPMLEEPDLVAHGLSALAKAISDINALRDVVGVILASLDDMLTGDRPANLNQPGALVSGLV